MGEFVPLLIALAALGFVVTLVVRPLVSIAVGAAVFLLPNVWYAAKEGMAMAEEWATAVLLVVLPWGTGAAGAAAARSLVGLVARRGSSGASSSPGERSARRAGDKAARR